MNRLHPLSAVSNAVSGAIIGFFLPFLTVSFLADPLGTNAVYALVPIGLVLGVSHGIATYYRFEYELSPDTFDVSSGVFARQSREIPYGRIQNVDLRQDLLHRILGVAVVSLETAGGGASEATLSFVTKDEAERIRTEVRRLTAESGSERATSDERASSTESATETPAVDADVGTETQPVTGSDTDSGIETEATDDHRVERTRLFELETRELLLYGTTAFSLSGVMLPVILFVFFTDGGSGVFTSGFFELSILLQAVLVVVPWALAAYLFSGLFTIARYYDFQLERAGDDYVYEHGLIQHYSGSIPIDKVQSVSITDNPIQRAFGYAGLWVETAGYGPESSGGSQPTVPFATEDRVYRFAERVTGIERPAFSDHPPIARRRYLARYTILATLLVGAAFVTAQVTALEQWYFAGLAFLAVPPAAHLKWKHMSYYLGEDHLVVRRGFWNRTTTVIPYYRIQTLTTNRTVLQRRLDLATVVVDTASSRTFSRSTPQIVDIDLEDARDVHDESRARLERSLHERTRDGVETSPTDEF
ncbi:PH domain-containing protein [Natronorubrum daqingense]|uniref:Putative membrane protein n=1 Tax=Natronorubrum daqingense TaxID=588898 RepID=A0A1N6X9E2_9EURY|nr:PH domain-containing protein [Natronorubrum daqingense]APX96012.1 hypothetical protein BB347_04910 [Natronorubrum daqingense]SIQ98889.1 putative membrane protein [Natronorubrum daqingense]